MPKVNPHLKQRPVSDGSKPTGTPAHQSPEMKEANRLRMLKLARRGYTKTQIGSILGLSQNIVSREFRAIIGEIIDDYRYGQEDMDLVTLKLVEIQEVKIEAWKALQRSKRPAVKTTVKKSVGGMGGDRKETTKEVKHQTGDPRYMTIILECIKAERAIKGTDAPTRHTIGIDWDMLASAHPRLLAGQPVPDELEEEVRKVLEQDMGVQSLEAIDTSVNRGNCKGSPMDPKKVPGCPDIAEVMDEDGNVKPQARKRPSQGGMVGGDFGGGGDDD